MGRRPRPFGLTPEQEHEYLMKELNRHRVLHAIVSCAGIIFLMFFLILLLRS